MTDTNIDFNKHLGAPVFRGLDEYTQKLRRNLLMLSTLTIFLAFSGAELDGNIQMNGLTLTGVKIENIWFTLFVINLYFFAHYLWEAWDSILEWRIRVTGTGRRDVDVQGIYYGTVWLENANHANDEQVPNLYLWWHIKGYELINNGQEDLVKKQQLVKRIEISLKNFDEFYWLFIRSQNLKFFVFDIALSLGMGGWAIWLSCSESAIKCFLA